MQNKYKLALLIVEILFCFVLLILNSKIIISAVLNGYDEFLRKKENPALFLMFDIKPESIDVNVHPTKREIKFKDEGPVYSTVRQIVRSRLTTKEVIPAIETKNENYASTIKPPENFSSAPVKYTTQEFSIPQSATTNFKKSLSTQLKYIGRILLAKKGFRAFFNDCSSIFKRN